MVDFYLEPQTPASGGTEFASSIAGGPNLTKLCGWLCGSKAFKSCLGVRYIRWSTSDGLHGTMVFHGSLRFPICQKVDIWMIGCILYTLMFYRPSRFGLVSRSKSKWGIGGTFQLFGIRVWYAMQSLLRMAWLSLLHFVSCLDADFFFWRHPFQDESTLAISNCRYPWPPLGLWESKGRTKITWGQEG